MQKLRNIAIIAHVDHGKTTLVDKMILAGNILRDNAKQTGELILAEAGGRTRTLPDDRELLYNEEDLRNPWFVCRSIHCKI